MKKGQGKSLEEKEHELLIEYTRKLLTMKEGREFISWVLDRCELYNDKFTGNSQTFMLLGKEAVGLDILGLLEQVSYTAYPELLLEFSKKKGAMKDE